MEQTFSKSMSHLSMTLRFGLHLGKKVRKHFKTSYFASQNSLFKNHLKCHRWTISSSITLRPRATTISFQGCINSQPIAYPVWFDASHVDTKWSAKLNAWKRAPMINLVFSSQLFAVVLTDGLTKAITA